MVVLSFAFFNSVFLARLAGPQIFGQYSYILSFVGLFSPLCIMGLNNIATKYFVKHPQNSHYYLLSALTVRLAGAMLSIVIGIVTAFYLTIDNSQYSLIITLLIFQTFTIFNVIEYYFIATNRVMFTLRIRLFVLTSIGIAKLVVIFNSADLTTLIILHGLEYCLIGIGYLWSYYGTNQQQNQKRHISAKPVFALFNKGKWLLLSGIAAVLYLKIDQIMLAHFYSTKEVAYYAAAAKLSEFWYVFPILVANAFNPKLIQLHKENTAQYHAYITQLLSFMVGSALTISLLTYLLSTFIINLVYGAQFQQSAAILNVHIFATLFIFQRAILSKWLIIEGLYKFSLLTHGIGAVINIGLNVLFIPKYGGLGAAWATLISYMSASFLSLALSKQTQPFLLMMCKAMLLWPAKLITIKQNNISGKL